MSDGNIENILPTLIEWVAQGDRCVVATLVWADGTSPRPPGSQMLISESGRSLGYLTGGCAEHAIVSEALTALREGASRAVRFGVGSPYLDIQLPCGSGIDVFFDIEPSLAVVQEALALLEQRIPIAIRTGLTDHQESALLRDGELPGCNAFDRWYYPDRRFLIAGAGPIVDELAAQAKAQAYRVTVISPDEATLDRLQSQGIDADLLADSSQLIAQKPDAYTAAALLFHEHEREPELLLSLLESPAFYIAALGSKNTHRARLQRLSQLTSATKDFDRINGPAGLDIGASNPAEIALSILAECVRTYRALGLPCLTYTGAALLSSVTSN